MADEGMKPFQMRYHDEWMAKVDDWRRKQPKIVSQAEAIRQLVIKGIESENHKPKKR